MTNTTSDDVDVFIVGQGLAGSTLALTLIERGLRVRVFDTDFPGGASRVAAGLITPVTGAKLKPQKDFDRLIEHALAHYRQVDDRCGTALLTEQPALRLISAVPETRAWQEADSALLELMQDYNEAPPAGLVECPTITAMPQAARLDAQGYVETIRQKLKSLGVFANVDIEPDQLTITKSGVEIPSLGMRADRLVFCRGYADMHNPFFKGLGWRPAKGQILTIRCRGFGAIGTVHANGMWITPTGSGLFLAGATYEWDALDGVTTKSARDDLTAKLQGVLQADYDIVGQAAGVRPIISGRMPVAGASAETARVLMLNGLGSKGALFAPTVSRQLAAHIVDNVAIEPRFDLATRIAQSQCD